MHIPAAALLASTLLLSGCAHIMQKPLVEGPTTATPLPMAPAATGGSLFRAGQAMNYGYQPMFEDRRPRNVGDTLTILLQENVSASKSSSASANRNGSAGMGLIAVPSKLNGWLGMAKRISKPKVKRFRRRRGGAQYLYRHHHRHRERAAAQRQPRRGGREADRHQPGTEFIRFSGVVNPRTISGSNTVPSTQWRTRASSTSATATSTKRRTWAGCNACS